MTDTPVATVHARFYKGTSNLGAFTNLKLSTRNSSSGPVLRLTATTPRITVELTPNTAVALINALADTFDTLPAPSDINSEVRP